MDEYGKKYGMYHMIQGGLIPEFDEETQGKLKKLIDLGSISIDVGLKTVKMTDPKVGLGNLPDDKIIELISIASYVGKQFHNHGWMVKY